MSGVIRRFAHPCPVEVSLDHSLHSKESIGVASVQTLSTDRYHRPTKISNKYINISHKASR